MPDPQVLRRNQRFREAMDAIDQRLVQVDDIIRFYDGAEIETIDIEVIEDGGNVKLQLQASGGGDVTFYFAGVAYTLDCTPVQEVTLTVGTDEVLQSNWVYVTEAGGVLTLNSSTSGYPSGPHAGIAEVSLQSAASLATDGAMRVHAWTDHFNDSTQNGHLYHVNAKFRAQPASWISGVTPSDLSSDQISTTAGVVFQLHPKTMPARDMSAGDPVWVVNDPDAAWTRITDFGGGGIDKLQDGTPIGNNKYVNIILLGVVSEKEADCKLLANLPTSQYTVESNAQGDVDMTSIYAFPTDFQGTVYLIARYTLQYSTGGGGTFTQSQKVQLLGQLPSTSPGGGAVNYTHPNHSGDVTSVGDGAQTIMANAVTNAKAADMAQALIKGRAAGAGTGDPTDLTAAQVRTILAYSLNLLSDVVITSAAARHRLIHNGVSFINEPTQGTSFPVSVLWDGRPFRRTDLGYSFHYDSGRAKWLGDELIPFHQGRRSTCASGIYLAMDGSLIQSAADGYSIPWDMTVVMVAYAQAAAVSGSWEVMRSGASVVTVTHATLAVDSDDTLDSDIAALGYLGCRNSVGAATVTDPQITIYARRHET